MKPALSPLKRALRDLFRVEPLEPRMLLSADPVLGAAQIVLRPPEQDLAAAVAEAYAAPADVNVAPPTGATVLVANHAQQPDAASQWLLVDTAQLDEGNGRVVVGGPDSNAVIHVGGADSALQLGDLVLVNPQAGGEVFLDGALQLAGSLLIQGSGHTTTLSADATSLNDIVINDSVLVAGNRTLSAGTDGTGNIQLGANNASTLNGNGDASPDTLVLRAADNVRFTGALGTTDPLEGITIDAVSVGGSPDLPLNVDFEREVTVNGDLVINASGVVTFKAKVVLTSGGDLRITGATQVIFQAGLELQGVDAGGNAGDIFIEGNEIDFQGGSESVKGQGVLTLRPTSVGYGIDLGSLPFSASQPTGSTLNLETSELKALADGFSKIVIGHQDGVHANAAAGAVRIGAIDALSQPTLRDPLEVYGGSISVEDLDNPDYQLLVTGTITLDAHGDITLANRIEANSGSGLADITLYSTAGKVQQLDAMGDLRSGEPLRAATLTVHAATGIALPYTEITTVSAVNTASGDLSITETATGGDVAIALLRQQAASGGISLQTTAGSISVGGTGIDNAGSGLTQLQAGGSNKSITVNQDIHSTAGAIRLTASGAITTDDDAGSVTHGVIATDAAADVRLVASGGAIQQGADIRSAGGLVSLDAFTTLTMKDGVRASSLNPSDDSGAVSMRARGGNLTVSLVEADGAVSLTAAGAILDGLTGNSPNIDGETAAVLLAAASGIGTSSAALQTRVYSLAASNTTTGGLFVREATALRLAGVGSYAVDLGGSDGSMAIYTIDGAITVEKGVRSTGAIGHLLLQTGELIEATPAGIDVRADLSSAHGSLSVLSADGITVDDQLAGSAPTLSVAAPGQTLDLEAASAIVAEGRARFATAGGALRLAANSGDVVLGVADAGTGTVSIVAGGRILDAQGDDGDAIPAANVIASAARLDGAGGIGAAYALLDTQVATLAASATGGAVFLAERDAVSVGSVAATTVNRISTQGTLASAVSDVGTLSGIAAGQALVMQAGGALSIDQAISAGANLRLAAGGALNVAAAAGTSGGHLSATAAGALSMSAAGVLASDGGTLDIQSTGDAVVMAAGAVVRSNAGTIRVQAASGVTVGLLDARTAADRAGNTTFDQLTWGAVSVVSGSAIADNAGETTTDIFGSSVRLQAVGAIGAGSEQLETEAGQLSATAGAGLFLTEASAIEVQQLAAISVQRVGLDGVAATGPIDAALGGLSSAGALTLQTQSGAILVGSNAAVAAAGNVRLYTQAPLADVTLDSAVSSSGGSISILSARDLILNADVRTAADGQTIDLHATRLLFQAQDTTIASRNGNVSVDAGDNATLENISAGTGGVWVSAAAILDGDAAGDSEVDITAASAQLRATAGAIGAAGAALETQVDTLSVSAATAMFLTESDGVTIDRLQLDVNRVGADGSTTRTAHAAQEDLSGSTVVVATLAGDLTLNAATANTTVVAAGSGNVRLEAASGRVVVAGAVGAGNVSVLGTAGVVFQGSGSVITAGGTIDVESGAGAIAMADGTVMTSGGGAIRLSASGDVTVGLLDAGAGSVSLVAGGSIKDIPGDTSADVLAGVLRLQAAGGIGAAGEALETGVAQLSASAGSAGVFLSEVDALTVTQTAAVSVNRVAADGVTLSAQTDAAQAGLSSGGALVLQTVNGTLATTAQGAVSAAGNVYLLAAGGNSDLAIGAAVSSSGGSMQLRGERDALLNASVSTAAQGRSISLSAGRDLTQAQGTSAATTNGGIELHAGGTVTLELLSAGTAGVAISGDRIVDGDAAGDSEVDIVASRAWLRGGHGIGAAGAQLETTVGTLRADAGAGDLFITESDAVALDLVTVDFQQVDAAGVATNASGGGDRGLSGRNVVLRTVNGGISSAAGTSIAATGNLLLQAGGAAADLVLAGTTAASGALSLLAGRDVTLSSAVGTAIDGSSIDIQAQGRIDAQQGSAINASNANVQLLALGGSVTLETVNAGTGTVRISGTSIVDGDAGVGETEVDIIAAQLLLTATSSAGTGANPLETAVGTLSVSAGGTVGIVDSDSLTVGSITTSVDRVGLDGATSATTAVTQANVSGSTVTLRTLAGALVGAASGGAVSASGNLLLKAGGVGGDITLDSAVTSSGGNITIDASGNLTQGATIATATGGKTIDLLASGNLLQAQGSALTTTNGHVSLAAAGTLTIESISAGIGRVSLSGASIVDGDPDGDSEVDVLAAGVRAIATAGGIGSAANPLETTITTLSAAAAGDVFLTETDALDLAAVTATVNRVANNGSDAAVTLAAQPNVSGATVVVRTLGGSLSSQSSGAVSASGNLLLQAGGAASDLNLGGTVSSSAGHLSLAAGQDIVLGANVSAAGAGKSVDLVAGRNLVQAQGTTLGTTDGNIGLQAGGSATIETLNAGAGWVRIAAGSIVDGDTGANETEVDVIGAGLQLVTTGAIGAANNALETTVQALAVSAGGNLFLAETDALTIAALAVNTQRVGTDGTSAVTANAATSGLNAATAVVQANAGSIDTDAAVAINASGNLLLKAGGPVGSDLLLRGNVSAGGDLTLDAARDLTLGAAVASTGAGRSLVLQAGRNFSQDPGSSASSNNGTIALTAGGNATLESLSAGGGTVRINAASVADGDADGDSEVDIEAAALGLVTTAGTAGAAGNALEIRVGTLALRTSGAAFLTESDALLLDTVGGAAQRVGTDGSSQALALGTLSNVNSGGSLVLQALAGSLASTASGGAVQTAGNLLLAAGGAASDLALHALVSAGSDITLRADRDLLLGASVSNTGALQTIDLAAGRDLVQAQGTQVDTLNGNIAVSAAGSATIESLAAGTAGVWISAGAIVDGDAAGDGEVDIRAGVAQLLAGSTIGAAGNALEIAVATLAARAGSDIFLTESDALVVGSAAVDVRRVDATGVSTATSHAATQGVIGATVVLRTVDGTLATQDAVTATGHLLLQAGGATGDLDIAGGASALGALSLAASRDIVLASSVATSGTTIDIVAQRAIDSREGSAINSGHGNVLLQAGGDVTIESVNAGTGQVRIVGAALFDGDTSVGETEVDIAAAQLQVSVAGAVGAAANPIETMIGTLSIAAGGSITVSESDALLLDATTFSGVDRVGADGSTARTGSVTQSDVVSTGGNIALTAQGTLTLAAQADVQTTGAATITVTSVAGSVMMDPNHSSLRTGSGDIHVTAEGDIQPGALITQGQAILDARNGRVLIRGDLQRHGEDVDLIGDDLVIEVPVSSPGGTLRIGPLDAGTPIVIGDTAPGGPALQVDTGELALLQDGFAQIVIGSSLPNQSIVLDGATSPLVFHDPLLLTASGAGGTLAIRGSVTGDTLTIADTGEHTTLSHGRLSLQGDVLVQDQLTVDGANTISAGQGGSGTLHLTQAITGLGGASDTLTLAAGGGAILLDQAISNLDGLSISAASNVTFGAAVSLTGDLVIEASGVVTFNGPLTLANGAHLIVRGGGQVVFKAGADLGSGDALLQVSGVQALGGAGSLRGQGLLQLQGPTAAGAIHVGGSTAAAGELLVGDDVLRAVGGGFRALQIGSGANAAAGAITLGDADLTVTGSPVQILGSAIGVAAAGSGVRLGTDLTLQAAGTITVAGRVAASTGVDIQLTSDTGGVAMQAGAVIASQGGHIGLNAATGLAVAGLDARGAGGAAGTVSLRTTSGQVTDANADAAIDVYAQAVDVYGRGLAVGSAQVLEVSAPIVRVDPAGGLVLRESGTDGRVYFDVLHGGAIEQVLVAVGSSQRITSEPDSFIAGGGLQKLAASTPVQASSPILLAGPLAATPVGQANTQVRSYLGAAGTTVDAGLTLSQRLQAEGALSFASGQVTADASSVDYWTESVQL